MNDKKKIENLIPVVMNKIECVYKYKKGVGIDSGFADFNTLLGGIQNELIVITSHPGIGKTALSMDFILKMAKDGLGGIVFSCDTSSEMLTQRLLSMEAGLHIIKLNHGLLKSVDVSRITQCCEELSTYPITIEDEINCIDDIVSEVRSSAKDKQIKWIVIDSFESIRASDTNVTVGKQIAEISEKLKSLQLEIGIPLIVTLGLKQANRKRMYEIHDLSDYRVLENNADTVIILRKKYPRKRAENGFVPVEVIVTKQKQGVDGVIEILLNPAVGSFHNKS